MSAGFVYPFGMRSPFTEISDDEGSVSDASQQESKRDVKRKGSNVDSEPEEELKVESDEEDNGEQGEDECDMNFRGMFTFND